jgi:hypothetical protein
VPDWAASWRVMGLWWLIRASRADGGGYYETETESMRIMLQVTHAHLDSKIPA